MKNSALTVCFTLILCTLHVATSLGDANASPINDKNSSTAGQTEKTGQMASGVDHISTGSDDGSQYKKPWKADADYNNTSTNCQNGTSCTEDSSYLNKLSRYYENGTINRAFYVLIGITCVVVIYFVIRTVRRRNRSKSKKYGVISMPGNDLEMAPLDADDEDDDVTVFEVNGHK